METKAKEPSLSSSPGWPRSQTRSLGLCHQPPGPCAPMQGDLVVARKESPPDSRHL